MKKLLFFCLLFFYTIFFAQLDRDHWFAPMVDRSAQNTYPAYQSLYLSTNELGPVKVDIYSNNVIIGTKTISKGNPQKFPIPRNFIITTGNTNLFKPVAMGLYVKGDKPFFASLRFSVNQHAEIVTSKGTAGIGTEFYATPAPIASSLNNVNFITSILATENNTQVTINNFDPTVQFSDNIVRNNFSFTLQQGEAFIIDGSSTFGQNWEGFIGAKITATAPISVTNGNFNGQYVPTSASSTDILMDQSVPIEKLGKEFVLVKGNGTIYQPTSSNYSQNMEKAYIVAAVNGTNIYVNDGTTPINSVPLNAGQPFVIGSEHYINQGNQQYNMLVRSTENIYVFQLLAGASGGNEIATGGYNYIPPLNCYLPKKIDEIGFVNENEGYKGGFYESTSPTKLNIITEAGAVVTVQKNGANFPLTAIDGPYPVSGSSNWVTYSIARPAIGTNNVSGNITVNSTKAVTAGISAGDGAVGYGGYFAGFSAIPLVQKVQGECLNQSPEVILAVTEGFDSYQWLLKQPDGSYINAPIPPLHPSNTDYRYYPTQAGIYAVKVKQGSCPEIQTPDKEFFNCTDYTNYDYNVCGSQTFTPTFALSSQTVNPATLIIVEPPTQGTIPTNPDGTIILDATGKFAYTANPGASGNDKFKYRFCGLGILPDCETVQITVHMIDKKNALLEECSTTNTATYDLSLANVTSDTTLAKSYFTTENGALNNITAEKITAFTNYTSPNTFVYVRLVNSFSCVAVAKIELRSKLAPEVKENLYTKLHCDEEIDGKIDGIYKVDLATIAPIVLVQASNFVIKYYEDLAQATAGLTNNIPGIFSFTANRSIWMRVEAPNGCAPVVKEIKLKVGTKFTINDPITVFECDNNQNNSEPINLSKYTSLFSADPTASVLFFNTLANAEANTPTTTDAQTITATRSFYYRFKRPGFCEVIGKLNISLKAPTPTALLDSYTVCAGSSQYLVAESSPTYKKWEWKKNGTVIFSSNTATLFAGVYTVSFTDASDCIFTKTITIVDSPKPVLNIPAYNATLCDSNFDGNSDPINFNTITPIIVSNFATNPGLYTTRYYLNARDRDLGNTNTIPNPTNWTFSANTTVYLRVESQFCAAEKGELIFKFSNNIPILTSAITVKECDEDFDGIKVSNLASYLSQFTTESGVTARYFNNLTDAQNNLNSISNSVTVDQSGTYYIRLHKSNLCDLVVKITINIQKAVKSDFLFDKYICPNTTTKLNAGAGFDAYKWSTGETSSEITVPIDDYWVELTTNNCTYKQFVSVKAVELPTILNVEITGSTVTVNVTGGNPPYQYAIDNGSYQVSNIFTNVRGGDHTISVISADNCDPVTAEINLIELYNAITPNDDGINDVLNYSALLLKEEPFMQIYDRYGKIVFKGDRNNLYSWDGKTVGKPVATGSYWYVMKWKEPGFSTVTEYSGWILVKNRD